MSGKYAAYALRGAPQIIATLHTQEVDFQYTNDLFEQVSVPARLQTVIDRSKSKERKVGEREDEREEDEMDEDGGDQSGSSFPSLSRYANVIPPSQWTVDTLKELQEYDEKLKKAYGDQTIGDSFHRGPGFSDIQAVAVKYVSENRAATDPGGARVATLAEMLAGDE